MDLLNKDLDDVKQQHQDAVTQNFTDFINQLTTAMNSSDAALNLYQSSGGEMPPPTPVQTKYDHETPTEQAQREQEDATHCVNLALIAQLHCGEMRFAALFITSPDQKGLQDDWIAWLKSATQTYLQIKDDGIQQARNLKGRAVRDSPISGALGFHGWGDKEQSRWSVRDIPQLYREQILEPLRKTPSADTLAAWDTYIAMRNLDQPDPDKWNQVDFPSLSFDRGCDDYAITPSTDKLQFLVELIKANPTHPQLDDMIARARGLLQDYRTRHPNATAAAPPPTTPAAATTATNANVNVTVTTSGDMTVVTTHTNAAPANPTP